MDFFHKLAIIQSKQKDFKKRAIHTLKAGEYVKQCVQTGTVNMPIHEKQPLLRKINQKLTRIRKDAGIPASSSVGSYGTYTMKRCYGKDSSQCWCNCTDANTEQIKSIMLPSIRNSPSKTVLTHLISGLAGTGVGGGLLYAFARSEQGQKWLSGAYNAIIKEVGKYAFKLDDNPVSMQKSWAQIASILFDVLTHDVFILTKYCPNLKKAPAELKKLKTAAEEKNKNKPEKGQLVYSKELYEAIWDKTKEMKNCLDGIKNAGEEDKYSQTYLNFNKVVGDRHMVNQTVDYMKRAKLIVLYSYFGNQNIIGKQQELGNKHSSNNSYIQMKKQWEDVFKKINHLRDKVLNNKYQEFKEYFHNFNINITDAKFREYFHNLKHFMQDRKNNKNIDDTFINLHYMGISNSEILSLYIMNFVHSAVFVAGAWDNNYWNNNINNTNMDTT